MKFGINIPATIPEHIMCKGVLFPLFFCGSLRSYERQARSTAHIRTTSYCTSRWVLVSRSTTVGWLQLRNKMVRLLETWECSARRHLLEIRRRIAREWPLHKCTSSWRMVYVTEDVVVGGRRGGANLRAVGRVLCIVQGVDSLRLSSRTSVTVARWSVCLSVYPTVTTWLSVRSFIVVITL